MSNDVRFIARPAFEQQHFDQSFDGHDAEVDSISEVAFSSLSSSEDEKSPVKKPRQKIRVLTPNPKWDPSGDKGSRRTPIDSYADTGTPVKDDRRKDNTWNPNVPRENPVFIIVCPRTKPKQPKQIVEIAPTEDTPSPSTSTLTSSDDNISPNHSVIPLTDDNSSQIREEKSSTSTEEGFDVSFDFQLDDGISSAHSTPKQEKLAIQLDSPGGTNLGTFNLTPNSKEIFRKVVGEQRAKDNIQ